ncbi:MAG: hypothetical protein AB1736_07890 [Chloroflexota bacterium]
MRREADAGAAERGSDAGGRQGRAGDTKVVATIVGGEVVYEAPALDG